MTWPWQDQVQPLADVLVRRAKAGAVETVMVGGAVVYREDRFTRVDRDATLAEIASALDRADTPAEWARRRLAADLIAPVRDFYRDWLRGA